MRVLPLQCIVTFVEIVVVEERQKDDRMYYIPADATTTIDISKAVYIAPLSDQCAWCTALLSGARKGEKLGYLVEQASHGCCHACQIEMLQERKARKLAQIS
jgi:hypothetical protein